jgi:hypothetical protein
MSQVQGGGGAGGSGDMGAYAEDDVNKKRLRKENGVCYSLSIVLNKLNRN